MTAGHHLPSDPAPLLDCFARYQRALQANQAPDGSLDGVRHIQAAEAVVRARVGLYRCLVALGWTPPAEIARHMQSDGRLMDEPDDRWLEDAQALSLFRP